MIEKKEGNIADDKLNDIEMEFSLNKIKKNSYDGFEREKKKIENNYILDFSLNKSISPKNNLIINQKTSSERNNSKEKGLENSSDLSSYMISNHIKDIIDKKTDDYSRKFSNNTTGNTNIKNKKILNLKDLISLDGYNNDNNKKYNNSNINNKLPKIEMEKKIGIKENNSNNNMKKKLNLNDILNIDKEKRYIFYLFILIFLKQK
jgi:hypothetical protein